MEIVLDSYYDYINILAFNILSKYESRKYIDISDLDNFRDLLYEELKNYIKYFSDSKNDVVIYNKSSSLDSLARFLKKYNAYFYKQESRILIKDDISYMDILTLERRVREEQKIPDSLKRCAYLNDVLYTCLGIDSIAKFITKYLKVEEKLKELYSKLYTEEDNSILRKDINDWINIRNTAFIVFSLFNYSSFEALTDIVELREDEEIEYDIYPVDVNKFYKSSHYDKDALFCSIEAFCDDLFMYAILGDRSDTLTRAKFKYDLDSLGFQMLSFDLANDDSDEEIEAEEIDVDEVDEEFFATMDSDELCDVCDEELTEEDYEEDDAYDFDQVAKEGFLFDMIYIKNIDNFIEVFGSNEELLTVKRKLLYLIERSGFKLYDTDNFNKHLEEIENIKLSKKTLKDMASSFHFLVDDVFDNETNRLTVPKLLIVKTYYQITNDEDIENILESHKKDFRFDLFSEIVLNDNRIDKTNKQYMKKCGDYFRKNNGK